MVDRGGANQNPELKPADRLLVSRQGPQAGAASPIDLQMAGWHPSSLSLDVILPKQIKSAVAVAKVTTSGDPGAIDAHQTGP